MKKNISFILFIVLGLFFVIGKIYSGEQEEEQKKKYLIKIKILKIKERMKYFNNQNKILDKQIYEYNKGYKEKVKVLQERVKKARLLLKKEKSIVDGLKIKYNQKKYRYSAVRNQLQNFKKLTGRYVTAYRTIIKSGLPYYNEQKTGQISVLLTENHLSDVTGLEIYNRLWSLVKKELLLSFDSCVIKSSVGNDKKWNYLRLGRSLLVKKSKNNEISLITRYIDKGKNKWKWDKDILDLNSRILLKNAFKIVSGKKAPDFICLPFSITLIDWEIK